MLTIIYEGKEYNIPHENNALISIDAYREECKQLQAENKRLEGLLAAVESVYPGRFKTE